MSNKLGIFSWFGFVMPLPQRLKLIKEAGFDGVTIWWEDEEGIPKIKKEDMAQMVKNAGLIFENIHVPYNTSNDFWNESKEKRDKLVKDHIQWLQDCAKFDIPMMVIHVSEGENPPIPNGYGVECIEKLVKIAEKINVKIAIENTRNPNHLKILFNEIKSEALGFCFDSSHAHLDKTTEELLQKFGTRLFATHISDNDGIDDRHWLPGNGIINLEKTLKLFPKEYKGFFTLEVCPTKKEFKKGPEYFIKKAYQQVIPLALHKNI